MEPDYLVVLYSKYSSQCKRVLDLYNQCGIDYIKFICIDNIEVRKRILDSRRLNVSTVPCVLLMYRDGTMEKFESGDVAGWLIKQLEKHVPSAGVTQIQAPEQPPPQQFQQPSPSPQPSLPPPQPQQTSILDLEEGMSQQEEPSKPMSVSEMAAKMAAEREKNQPPNPAMMPQN